jgi:hypothetical protein
VAATQAGNVPMIHRWDEVPLPRVSQEDKTCFLAFHPPAMDRHDTVFPHAGFRCPPNREEAI